ncbi:alpha/beta fold hydrolase [Amorphus orientalis]|uniref:Pimeloyl-ACP methyl ester carboxylesterase n=1 Tax=Amorphus orientalis TaxID=649198 RepID=A0AAE3VN39_9HYPH|nr:alpha/beta hydrolase [Amorphus orientalis]MDQ0314992.1 pimeloyl-ACP methyl ester carboxylesterase [Amorphus orientalis]
MTGQTSLSLVETSHGVIAVEDTHNPGTPVLLIHGNSSCRDVFQHQLDAPFARRKRLVAIDLPGHGDSDDAIDPARTYTRSGLADAVDELLGIMGMTDAVVVGWSLGGHVGIDLLVRSDRIKGLLITGTPPVRNGGMAEGFNTSPRFGLAARAELSDEDVADFARAMLGKPVPPFLPSAIRRTDRRFRRVLFEAARAGTGADQRLAVERTRVPIAVVNGAADPLLNLDYLEGVAYGNLWDGRCYRLPGAGHAPFWQASVQFNTILERFLDDLT